MVIRKLRVSRESMGKPAVTQRGEEQIEKLCAEAACPACEYSLRGLPGEIINCPECGQKINIVKLVTTQWKGPWYQAPMYDALAIPVGWTIFVLSAIYLTGLSLLVVGFYFTSWHALVLLTGLAGELWIARMVRKRFGEDHAYTLVLLLHLVVVMYLGCAYVLYLEHQVIYSLVFAFSWTAVLRLGMILPAIVLVLIIANRVQRYVGGRCIRRYLRLMV